MTRSHPVSHLRGFACALFAALSLLPAPAAEVPQIESQFDFSADTTAAARKFYFETIPGRRYTLQRSTDLQTWSTVSGYPKTAAGLAIGHTFVQAANEFFRIESIDEQVPVIVDQFPGEDAFAVRRFDDLRFLLGDASGIDPASIRLTLGNGAALSIGAPGLTFVDNVLTYDSGDAALGDYGATVPVTLTMADTLGHSVTHAFSFTLEVLPKVVPNLFVFGSPTAQRAGQQIPATPTAAPAKSTGPVRMDAPKPWVIETVLADRVIIAYNGPMAPVFSAGMYLSNESPVTINDIFNRKIFSVSDDITNKKITLITTDVPLSAIVEEGTISLSSESRIYDLDAGGTIQKAIQWQRAFTFPAIGINKDGAGPLEWVGNPKVSVSLPEAHVWLTPSLAISIETKAFSLRRADVQVRGDIEAALVPELRFLPLGSENKKVWDLHPPLTKLVWVGAIGIVPVWIDCTYSTKLRIEAEADVAVRLTTGWRRAFSISARANYANDANPRVKWARESTDVMIDNEPLTLSLGGTVRGKLSLVPQLDVRLESVLGFYINVEAREEAEISASGSLSFSARNGSLQISPGATATLGGGLFADFNAGLSIVGVDKSYLPKIDAIPLVTRSWGPLTFPNSALVFTAPVAPQMVSVPIGGALNLEGQAQGGDGAIFYQWEHNGMFTFSGNSRHLTLYNVTSDHAGTYTLRARAGTETVTSPAFTVTPYNAGAPLSGFAYIPAGSFEMGQTGIAEPVHSVYVSGFYMGRTEVTWLDWRTVRDWARASGLGYTDLSDGAGKADTHPVHTITWYDMVKWCNAKSEKENLTPCYTVSGETYKTGYSDAVVCNWSANGYRLPTEAEWEKAARGGLSGKLFPWGDTISHSQANYYAQPGGYTYDVSLTSGFHPTYNDGVYPYTAPVDSFTANGHGLFNMAGNVWEWCWDWHGSYTAGSQTDPRGATSGSYRVRRGGRWGSYAHYCRVAYRYYYDPTDSGDGIGFRVARSSVP